MNVTILSIKELLDKSKYCCFLDWHSDLERRKRIIHIDFPTHHNDIAIVLIKPAFHLYSELIQIQKDLY